MVHRKLREEPGNQRRTNFEAWVLLLLLLVPAALVAADGPGAEPENYVVWHWGTEADVTADGIPRIEPPDRIGKADSEGEEKFRWTAATYQVKFNFPAFDFDPNNYGAANHPFYLTIRYKDVANRAIQVAAGKGGCGFYGAGPVGSFGGAGDGQWKEETLIVPRSSLRCSDGKTYEFKFTEPAVAVPVASMTLFSAQSRLEGAAEKIAAAHKADAAKREALRQKLLLQFKNLGTPEPGRCPENTEAEKARGFRVFFPALNRQLFGNSQPQAGELTEDLHLYACNGQAVSILVGVRALKPIGKMSVQFVNPVLKSKAAPPPADPLGANAEQYRGVRWATWSEQRVGSSWGTDYRVCAEQLVLGKTNPVAPERLEIAQVEFRVAGQPAGDLHGLLIFIADEGGTYTIPVTLTVYPFNLERPEHSTHGQFYYISYGNVNPFELLDMADHGMDSVVADLSGPFASKADGTRDTEATRAAFKMLKQFGYRAPLINDIGYMTKFTKDPKNHDGYVQVIAETLKIAEEEGFNEMAFFPVDEPHSKPLQQVAKTCCTWISDTPKANTFITSNPDAVKTLDPVLNYVSYNLAYINEKTPATMKPHQKLMYYIGSIDSNPEYNRYRPGFLMYKVGAYSTQYFAYMEFAGDPYLDLDGSNRDWNAVYPSLECPLPDPTLQWKAIREGVYDYRYMYTLQQWIDKAKKAGKQAAAEAGEKTMAEILAVVDADGKKAGGPAVAIEANVALKGEKVDAEKLKAEQALAKSGWYDASRQKLATAIIELQKALK